VAYRSVKYGFPPFVTRYLLPAVDFRQLQEVLVAMKDNPSGKSLLAKLNLDGFQVAPESVFASIGENMHMLHLG
jgi:phosphonate transport system substrate-binding protein